MRIKSRIIFVIAVIATVGTIIYIYPKSSKTTIEKEPKINKSGEKFNLDTGINAKLNGGIIMPDMFNTTEKYVILNFILMGNNNKIINK